MKSVDEHICRQLLLTLTQRCKLLVCVCAYVSVMCNLCCMWCCLCVCIMKSVCVFLCVSVCVVSSMGNKSSVAHQWEGRYTLQPHVIRSVISSSFIMHFSTSALSVSLFTTTESAYGLWEIH